MELSVQVPIKVTKMLLVHWFETEKSKKDRDKTHNDTTDLDDVGRTKSNLFFHQLFLLPSFHLSWVLELLEQFT